MTVDMVNPRPQTIIQQQLNNITASALNNNNRCNKLLQVDHSCSVSSESKNNIHTAPDTTQELSLGYSKITNPVSIKAERLDAEITLASDMCTTTSPGVIDCIRTLHPIVQSITRATVTSNNTATLNLNEINRTQSEKELMAMVDGNNISADGKLVFFSYKFFNSFLV